MTWKPLDAAIDTVRALLALTRTSVLFRVRGRLAVARAAASLRCATYASSAISDRHSSAIWRAHRAVRRARRLWPVEVTCLQSALVLDAVLAARGIPATLQIGVRKRGDRLLAHAWLEIGDLRLDDQPNAADDFILLRPPEQSAAVPA